MLWRLFQTHGAPATIGIPPRAIASRRIGRQAWAAWLGRRAIRARAIVTEFSWEAVPKPAFTNGPLAPSAPVRTAPADAYCLLSSVFLMVMSASRRLETDRPTAVLRTIDPLGPVSPACSEPAAVI